MKTYICQICGEAHIGSERPSDCPFCGAHGNFIKVGKESDPILNHVVELSEVSRKNLEETLALEKRATAIYVCMSEKADTFEVKTMYKRLSKVEEEHANVAAKFLGLGRAEIAPESCSEDDVENFKKTIELEEHATGLYARFSKEATETDIKIFFTALAQVEKDHIELIKNYL